MTRELCCTLVMLHLFWSYQQPDWKHEFRFKITFTLSVVVWGQITVMHFCRYIQKYYFCTRMLINLRKKSSVILKIFNQYSQFSMQAFQHHWLTRSLFVDYVRDIKKPTFLKLWWKLEFWHVTLRTLFKHNNDCTPNRLERINIENRGHLGAVPISEIPKQ